MKQYTRLKLTLGQGNTLLELIRSPQGHTYFNLVASLEAQRSLTVAERKLQAFVESEAERVHEKRKRHREKIATVILLFYCLLFTGCVVGRLDTDNLRFIPLHEVHRMDDKGFPLNLFQKQNCSP